GQADAVRSGGLSDVGDRVERLARDAARNGSHADVVLAVALLVDAHVVATVPRGRKLGCRTIGKLVAEVVTLEHLTELLCTPVLDEELEARARAQAAVAVVAEDARDAGPDIGHA